MLTDDLLMLLTYINNYYPDVLIDHIDNDGIVYCSSFHKIDLFMFRARTDRADYLAGIFSKDPI